MDQLNPYSATLTQSDTSGGAQAMLMATGLTREDLNKPQIGIGSVWYEGNPCNMHLNDLAAEVKAGVESMDLVGFPLIPWVSRTGFPWALQECAIAFHPGNSLRTPLKP